MRRGSSANASNVGERERAAIASGSANNIPIHVVGGSPADARRMHAAATNSVTSSHFDLGDEGLPVNSFSIWITKSNADITMYMFQAILQWLGARAVKGAFATERGGQKRQLHLQGFAVLHCPATARGVDMIKASLKSEIPVPLRCGYRVDVKPFEGAQNATWMLGYIMKDNSEMWWNMGILGYSEADCRTGLNMHCTNKIGRFEDGKTLLNKKDFLHAAFSFYATNLTPLQLSIVQILRFMLLSGRYLPSTSWITPAGDKPLSMSRTQVHFKWAQTSHDTTVEEVQLYFFGDGTGVPVRRNARQHRSESGLYTHEGESPNFVVLDNAHWTEASGWIRDDRFDTMGYTQAKEESLRHRDGIDTQNDRDQALIDGGGGYYSGVITTVPTTVATNGTYLLGQDTDPGGLRVCDLPAEYADPVVNYRNFIVLGVDDTNDSGYFMDTEGAQEHCIAESVHPIANFRAWEGRDAVDDDIIMSSGVDESAAHASIPRYLDLGSSNGTESPTVKGPRRRKRKKSKKNGSQFFDVEAEHSGSDDSDDSDDSDGEGSDGSFIVPDHDSEPGSGNESNAEVTRTRTGRRSKPARRFDSLHQIGQRYD
jgi:hypothetical protein